MDLFYPIILFMVFCVLFSICGWCCKKHRQGTVYGFSGRPTVTVTTQPASSVIPPYPVSGHIQQVPQPGFGTVGGYQNAPYPPTTSPYPPAPATTYPPQFHPGGVGMPTSGMAPYPPHSAPYPPANVTPYPPAAPYPSAQQPPSYTEAVSQPPPPQPQQMSTGYTKQTPYNPNY